MSEGVGPLNLSDANIKGFDAVEPGRYHGEVHEVTWDAVKNTDGTGKMPAGTPMLKVQFRLIANAQGETEGLENRRVFTQFVIPPADYDEKKAATMKGMLARFLIAAGYEESDVLTKKFEIDTEDLKGREVALTLGREPKKDRQGNIVEDEFNNPVKGIKHIDTLASAAPGSLI